MRRPVEQRVTTRLIGGFILCLCMGVAFGCSASHTYDPVCMDPPLTEADRAHGHRATVEFDSGGVTLEGVLYQAPGSGPHPTVVYLHGYPGGPAGFDLAMALRRAGWNVLMFHYRGSWASAGSFSVRNGLEDVQAVVRHLRSQEIARKYAVDPKRIALVGHSAGAWYALMAAAADPEIEAVVSIAAVNVGAVGRELAQIDFEDAARMMEPPRGIAGITGDQLAREFIENADAFDLMTKVDALAQRSIMLVAGERDSVAPPQKYHWPLVHALEAKGARRLRHLILDDDHHFLNSRIALARAITRWLGEPAPSGTQ